jgi:hypothetical protein
LGLYERWTYNEESSDSKIPVHTFACALREHSRGAVTRQQVIDAFTLAGDDITELDAIRTQYQSLATQEEKDAFIVKFHDVMILCEAGFYDKAKAKNELGF